MGLSMIRSAAAESAGGIRFAFHVNHSASVRGHEMEPEPKPTDPAAELGNVQPSGRTSGGT